MAQRVQTQPFRRDLHSSDSEHSVSPSGGGKSSGHEMDNRTWMRELSVIRDHSDVSKMAFAVRLQSRVRLAYLIAITSHHHPALRFSLRARNTPLSMKHFLC